MKRIVTMFWAMALAVSLYAQKQLVILHTNDTHSAIMPVGKYESNADVSCRGGFVRRAAVINEERKRNPELLLFDSGDFSQGSTYYTLFKGQVEIGLMNIMGYDAATLGNHEFDFGLENMAKVAKAANFPIVRSNCDFTGTCVEGLIKPYTVIERGGLKIGVMGLAPVVDGLVMKENIEGVKYIDAVEAANKTAKLLKDELDCDVVICLSHLGWSLAPSMDDQQLIAQTHGIDIVLGGHSHTFFTELERVDNLDGKPVPVNQNGNLGAFVGRLEVSLDKVK